MLKKILYAIIVIVIIVILAIMWQDSKKAVAPAVETNQVQSTSPSEINKDIDNIDVQSGIDTDLNTLDADIKTL